MAAPSDQDLELLRRFGGRPEGRLLVSVLQSRLADLDIRNRRAIGEELYRCQGRALEIEDVLQILDASAAPAGKRSVPQQPNRTTPYKLPLVNHMHVPDLPDNH